MLTSLAHSKITKCEALGSSKEKFTIRFHKTKTFHMLTRNPPMLKKDLLYFYHI